MLRPLALLALLALVLVVPGCSQLATGSDQEATQVAVSVDIQARAEAASQRVEVDLDSVIDRALVRIDRDLDLPHVDVEVLLDPRQAIPETGVGGFSDPETGNISLAIDPASPRLKWTLTSALPVTLAHELHHAARILTGPGYGSTLEQAIVTEGLADAFSVDVFPAAPASTHPWTQAPGSRLLCRWWRRARAEPDSAYHDHEAWFFGTSDQIPRWIGYQLGTAVVSSYLARHPDATPADLVDADAATLASRAELC